MYKTENLSNLANSLLGLVNTPSRIFISDVADSTCFWKFEKNSQERRKH